MKARLRFPVIIMSICAAGFFWTCDSKPKSETQSSEKIKLSKDLVKANELTQQVYYYVEQVEMKKMTQEEANKHSNSIKVELQTLRSQLSRPELMYNDSMRKVYGNIMVDNVMRWRKENGLLDSLEVQ